MRKNKRQKRRICRNVQMSNRAKSEMKSSIEIRVPTKWCIKYCCCWCFIRNKTKIENEIAKRFDTVPVPADVISCGDGGLTKNIIYFILSNNTWMLSCCLFSSDTEDTEVTEYIQRTRCFYSCCTSIYDPIR